VLRECGDRPSRYNDALFAADLHRSSGAARLRRLTSLITICSIALLAPLLYPLLTGRVFVYNDLAWFHLPVRYLYQQALQAGDTVLWTPSIFSGLYLHGEGQVGMFHPFHQLLYRLLPLGTAFNLELVASYPLAFAGTFWFLRRLRFSHAAALFGAMLFAFSGFNLLHHHHVNMVAIVAHMPWLLAAADVLIVEEQRRARTLAFAAMAVIIGSGFLLGFPQAVWWNALALAAFGLFRAAETRRWRRLLPCGGAVALGVLLGGIQLLPSAATVGQSVRMGLSREFALTYSLHPANLIQLWSPYFFARGAHSVGDYMWFHEFGIYSGAILPVALVWVWIRRHALPERRALIATLTAFAGVMLVLALGRYGGLAVLLTHVPVLQSLRAPVRYVVLMQFALAILAAVTMDDLLAIAEGRSMASARPATAVWIPTALGVATTVALNGHLLSFGTHTFASAGAAAPGVAIVAAVTLLVHLAARRVRWALAALVVVTAVDLGALGIRFIYREPPRTIADLTEAVPPAPAAAADSYAAAPAEGPYKSDLLVLRGYRLTSGYAGLFPASRHPLDSEIGRRLSGTRWIVTPDGTRHPADGAVPRVRLLDELGRDAAGSARLVVDRPGRLVAAVDAPGPRVVALTERFHDGWSATVGGVPLQVVRVENDFLGCLVDGGVHQVELRFWPSSFVYGAIVSAIAGVLLAGVLIAGLR
jgi:hypothetical protein